MKHKISAAVMACDEQDWIEPCIKSVIGVVDEVVVVIDSKSRDKTLEIATEMASREPKIRVYVHKWIEGSDQKQFMKDQCTGDWILFLDADEIYGDDLVNIHEVITALEERGAKYGNVKSHHFMYHLCADDATVAEHYTPQRLMKNDPNLRWPKGQRHAIQPCKTSDAINIPNITMYHYGSCKNMMRVRDKYINDKRHGFHHPDFLERWYQDNLLGTYPVRMFKPEDHPRVIKDLFELWKYKTVVKENVSDAQSAEKKDAVAGEK